MSLTLSKNDLCVDFGLGLKFSCALCCSKNCFCSLVSCSGVQTLTWTSKSPPLANRMIVVNFQTAAATVKKRAVLFSLSENCLKTNRYVCSRCVGCDLETSILSFLKNVLATVFRPSVDLSSMWFTKQQFLFCNIRDKRVEESAICRGKNTNQCTFNRAIPKFHN